MSQWFFSRQGQTFGPLSFDQLRQLAAEKKLSPDELVWVDQAKQWLPAKSVAGLYATAAAKAPANLELPRKAAAPPARAASSAAVQAAAPPGQRIATAPPVRPVAAPAAAAPMRIEPGSTGGPLQKLRSLPKPVLFGLFGALGGLLGALLFGQPLWMLLAPAAGKIEKLPPLQMAVSSSLKAYPGGSNKAKVKIARHDFKGTVELEAGKNPDGILLSPTTIADDETEAELRIEANKSLAPGKYTVNVVAKGPEGSDVPPVNGSVELVVEETPPFLRMSVTPKVEVFQGGKTQFLVRVKRHNFANPVTLQFDGVPAGLAMQYQEIPGSLDETRVVVQAPLTASLLTTKVGVKALAKLDSGQPLDDSGEFQLEVKETPIPKVDVLFVLDLTGSMGFAIDGIKNGIKSFVDQLKGKRIDARIGLLGFRDIEADLEQPFTLKFDGKTFTTDYKAFADKVGELQARGGGDGPESSPLALVKAAKEEYRPEVGKVIILITDNIPKYHPNVPPASMIETIKEMQDGKIDQVHLVVKKNDYLNHFQPLHGPFKGTMTEIDPAKNLHDFLNSLNKSGPEAKKRIVDALMKIDKSGPDVQNKNLDQCKNFLAEYAKAGPETQKEVETELEQFGNDAKDAALKSTAKDCLETLKRVKTGDAFAAILPKLSESISELTISNLPQSPSQETLPPPPPAQTAHLPPATAPDLPTLKAVQSSQTYAKEDSAQLLLVSGVWAAAVAAVVCILLIGGQRFYLRQSWFNLPNLAKGLAGGLVAGLIGGVLVQGLFQMTSGEAAWDMISRTVGWGLLGALIGTGMALFIPNLKWHRGLQGGLVGGILGALGFLAADRFLGEVFGRLAGATILGFCIGVMIALAELAFRRYWLEITFSAREVRTVTLGTAAVGIGGDERLASVFVQGAPALALRYRLDGERVVCEDVASGQAVEAPPGSQRQVNNVSIKVCSPASARSAGYALVLAGGKRLPLGEGMPLTADDIPGLQPQGADGTVALISPRPNAPQTLLLRNRSKQTWAVQLPDGARSTVEPGRAMEMVVNALINFGQVQGKLVSADGRK